MLVRQACREGSWRTAGGRLLPPSSSAGDQCKHATIAPEALLKTERPDWLEKGRDVSKRYGPCDKLKLACAWKFDHPGLMDKYTAGKKRVQQELEQLENRGEDVSYVPGLPVKTAPAHGFTLSQACNEVILCMASTQISCYPCCQRA